MGEAKQRKLLAEKHGGEKSPGKSAEASKVAQELQRRLDRREPIEDTRDWFLKQKKVWEG
jgi:hypothetical protein